jgi:tetratricopeptide (TPR) repeat protein
MNKKNGNTCAKCGAPIKTGKNLCNVCSKEASARISMVPCRACGAANPSGASVCSDCGAPLSTVLKERFEISSDAPLSLAVTRRAELQVLEDCFNVCVEKNIVGAAVVTGASGMGVSTLLKEFAERMTGRIPRHRIFHIRNREIKDVFGPFASILKQSFEIDEDPDPIAVRLKLTNHIGKLLGADSAALVTETAHLLGHIAGISFPQSPALKTLQVDHDMMFKRLKETLVRFLEAEARDQPAVFIFDEVHQLTDETLRFLQDIFASLNRIPSAVILGGRPELNEKIQNPSIVRIRLERLDDEIMRSLFSVFIPKLKDPPEDLIDITLDRAAGNPGSLFELCALLEESGVIEKSGEEWTADVSKLAFTDMPISIVDTLKARIDRLDPMDKLVLQHAAIFGDVFWDEAILSMSRLKAHIKDNINAAQIWADDSDNLMISSSIGRLVERQFAVQLPEQDIKGAVKYAFARSGIRQEVVKDIDEHQLRQSHILAAEWLAHVRPDSNASLLELESQHWELAGERRRASLACFRAAREARSRYLNQKAIKLFKKGLEIGDLSDRIAVADAYHDLGSVYELLGRYDEAEDCFTKMLKEAWILAHRGKAGAAFNKIGRLYRARGDAAAAGAFLNRGMTLFKAAGDEKGVAACLGDMGELARRQGSYDRAFRLVNEALEIQRKIDNKPSIAVCLHSLGHIEAARASYAQAERYLEEALDLRRQAGRKGGMAHTLSALAIVLFSRGDLDGAIKRWEAALELAEEVGDRRMLAIVHNNMGEALRDQGKLDQSMKHFQACEEVVTTLDDRLLHSEVSRNIGILAQKMGNFDSAKKNLERALALARDLGGREMEGLALRALGELESTTMWDTSNVDGKDKAESSFEKALAIFKSIGNDFEVARTLHAVGNRLLERGNIQEGKARLQEAESIFRRIDSKAGDKISRTIQELALDGRQERSSMGSPLKKKKK